MAAAGDSEPRWRTTAWQRRRSVLVFGWVVASITLGTVAIVLAGRAGKMAAEALARTNGSLAAEHDTIRARRIELVNQDGALLLSAEAGKSSGEICIYTVDGVKALEAYAGKPSGGYLALFDPRGKRSVEVSGYESGGSIDLLGSEGKIRMLLAARPGGGSGIGIYGNQNTMPVFDASSDSGLAIRNDSGAVIFGVGPEGKGARIAITDVAGGTYLLKPPYRVPEETK